MANIRSLDGDGDVDIIGGSRTSTGATQILYDEWVLECASQNSCDESDESWNNNGGSIGFLVYWENTSGKNAGQCLDLYILLVHVIVLDTLLFIILYWKSDL